MSNSFSPFRISTVEKRKRAKDELGEGREGGRKGRGTRTDERALRCPSLLLAEVVRLQGKRAVQLGGREGKTSEYNALTLRSSFV